MHNNFDSNNSRVDRCRNNNNINNEDSNENRHDRTLEQDKGQKQPHELCALSGAADIRNRQGGIMMININSKHEHDNRTNRTYNSNGNSIRSHSGSSQMALYDRYEIHKNARIRSI